MDEENKKRILIVDSDSATQAFITKTLEGLFCISTANSGNGTIAEINNNPPELLIVDPTNYNTSGIKICKAMKEEFETSHIPIIFLIEQNNEEEKAAAYDTGCDDYIAKPLCQVDILNKIRIILNHKDTLNTQKQQSDNNMRMAMTLMSQNGETGHVLHFLKDSFLTKTTEDLCQLIMSSSAAFDLKVTVRANTNPPIYSSHDGEIKQIDQQILDSLHMMERLIYFGNRCLVNFEHISLLIKNMPVDDDDKNGRLKDHIALIMEGADAQMVSLQNKMKLAAREQGLSKMLNSTQHMINEIESDFNNNANKNSQIMLDLGEKIEWNFVQLGLSDGQENELKEIVENAINESINIYKTGLSLDKKLTDITDELNGIMKDG